MNLVLSCILLFKTTFASGILVTHDKDYKVQFLLPLCQYAEVSYMRVSQPSEQYMERFNLRCFEAIVCTHTEMKTAQIYWRAIVMFDFI